jgi:hypothetical protein
MCHYERWQRHCTKAPERLSKYCLVSMRCAVGSIVIAFAFAPQAFAVLRPLFPTKPEPPFSGEAIVTRGDFGPKNKFSGGGRANDRPRDKPGLGAALSCSLKWGMLVIRGCRSWLASKSGC